MMATAPNGDPAIVLIADDDVAFRLLLRRVLEREGYEVVECGDGAAALDLCEQHKPELVLMDAVMPVLDGFGACARLHDSDYTVHPPVLMITGLDDDASVERAFRVGATDYVTKPINISVLKHRVRRILLNNLSEKKIIRLAYHDFLTGLPNRQLFLDRFHQAIARATRTKTSLALLFIDIDRFKVINDSLGHEAGDQLLRALGERLANTLRRSDTVARLGGDEFTVMLEGVRHADEAAVTAKHILRAFSEHIEVGGRELAVSASIGIAIYPGDGEDFGTLLKNADTAMYRAKDQGRNNFQFYTAEMSAAAMRRLVLETSLRRAIQRNEFVVHYQPIIELASNRTAGVEALTRWVHPDTGPVLPKEFIPLAEETGLVVPLGELVLRAVSQQWSAWGRLQTGMQRVSVNLSPRQFLEPSLVADLSRILQEHQIEPQYLELELTESTLMQNVPQVEGTLRELHQLGVHIAIDDFGTGCSSLAYLKRFPIDTIKIDRSFVAGIEHDRHDLAVVQAMVGLAQTLDLRLVAEGVETEEQLRVLTALGCGYGQGYFWSEPLPAAEYERRFLSLA